MLNAKFRGKIEEDESERATFQTFFSRISAKRWEKCGREKRVTKKMLGSGEEEERREEKGRGGTERRICGRGWQAENGS